MLKKFIAALLVLAPVTAGAQTAICDQSLLIGGQWMAIVTFVNGGPQVGQCFFTFTTGGVIRGTVSYCSFPLSGTTVARGSLLVGPRCSISGTVQFDGVDFPATGAVTQDGAFAAAGGGMFSFTMIKLPP
jgi:hypothetical protein